MKKIIRLTESDLIALTKKIINESKKKKSLGNIHSYEDTIKYDGKEIEYSVVYDWDLGMDGQWDWNGSEITYNNNDVSDEFSDDDVEDIKKAIVKKIKKETGIGYR